MPEMEARANRLAVVAYPDQETAEQVLASLSELQTEGAINLADAVVVTRSEDGRVELHESGGPEKRPLSAERSGVGRSGWLCSPHCSASPWARPQGPQPRRPSTETLASKTASWRNSARSSNPAVPPCSC
jgi:hypothetical protein